MARWGYMHVFVPAMKWEGTGEKAFFGLGAETMESVYAWDEVNEQVNELGDAGWELLSVEPHWIWSTQTVGAPLWALFADKSRRRVEAATAYPEYIVGWYCTFRREEVESWASRKETVIDTVRSGLLKRREMLDPVASKAKTRVAEADARREARRASRDATSVVPTELPPIPWEVLSHPATPEGGRGSPTTEESSDAGEYKAREWRFPKIPTDLEPLDLLDAVDVAAADLWDEVAIDHEEGLYRQRLTLLEDLGEPQRAATYLVEALRGINTEDLQVRTAANDLTATVHALGEYIFLLRTLSADTDESAVIPSFQSAEALIDSAYDRFKQSVRAIDPEYEPAFDSTEIA